MVSHILFPFPVTGPLVVSHAPAASHTCRANAFVNILLLFVSFRKFYQDKHAKLQCCTDSIVKSSSTTSVKGFARTLLADEALYNFATFCLKASILYLYHRIFFVSRRFTTTLCALALFILTYSTIQGVGAFLQCIPVNSNWDPKVKRFCLHIDIAATVFAVCNVVTDFIILALPMPMLWQMQKPTKKKVQIMGMFLLGGL